MNRISSCVKSIPRYLSSLVRLTDQLRDGAWVVIARTDSPLCPVAMSERYMRMANATGAQCEKYLFRAIVNTNGPEARGVRWCQLHQNEGIGPRKAVCNRLRSQKIWPA